MALAMQKKNNVSILRAIEIIWVDGMVADRDRRILIAEDDFEWQLIEIQLSIYVCIHFITVNYHASFFYITYPATARSKSSAIYP